MKMTKVNIAALCPGTKPQLHWDANRDHPGLGILVEDQGHQNLGFTGKGAQQGCDAPPIAGPGLYDDRRKGSMGPRRPPAARARPGDRPKGHPSASRRPCAEALDTCQRKRKLRERSRADYRGRVERQLKPWLELPISAITPEMAQARFLAISDEVEARRASGASQGGVNVTGGATANGALVIFNALWRDQKARDPAMASLPDPTVLVRGQWHKLKPRKRRVAAEDLARFYAAIQGLPEVQLYRDLLSLAIFTGWREGELIGLRWVEVDLKDRMIHIPEERMKNHRDFDLPMSRQVAELLIARRALGRDGPFVFPGNGRDRTHDLEVSRRAGQDRRGMRREVSPHDLRRSQREHRPRPACRIHRAVEKMLVAHSTDEEVHEAYVVLGDKEVRADVQIVADCIAELCGLALPEGVARLESAMKLGRTMAS